MADLVGQRLGQYQLREVIRRGRAATVYKAHQASLDRWVAVTVPAHPGDARFVARFGRAADAIATLRHPNIVPFHDHGEQAGRVYLVTEYVAGGRTLDGLLGEPMEPAAACALIGHVLGALAHAHERGLAHGDLEPGDVLMPSTTWPMLTGFGIRALLRPEEGPRDAPKGPDDAATGPAEPGPPVDARADLHSAGIMLYRMVTGEVPPAARAQAATSGEPTPEPRGLPPDLPEPVAAILRKALAAEPAERYATAAETADAVRDALDTLRPAAARPADALASAYEAGVRAYTAGRWEEAIGLLGQVAEQDPGYEDVEALLTSAHNGRGGDRGPDRERSATEAGTADETSTPR
jgi:serine/threonine protein kinase